MSIWKRIGMIATLAAVAALGTACGGAYDDRGDPGGVEQQTDTGDTTGDTGDTTGDSGY